MEGCIVKGLFGFAVFLTRPHVNNIQSFIKLYVLNHSLRWTCTTHSTTSGDVLDKRSWQIGYDIIADHLL